MTKNTELYIRNIIFGMIDSLVSTVGLLAGIDATGTSRHLIILAGLIYALVEGFSMAVGSFLSEQSVEEYKIKNQVGERHAVRGAVIMFVSFVLASFIQLVPYIYFSLAWAIWFSVSFSIAALFIVGLVAGKISKVNILKRGFMMAFLGAMAIIIGFLVGKFVKIG